MKRLYRPERTVPGYTTSSPTTIPACEVPSRRGIVTEVIPAEGECHAVTAHYAEAYDMRGELVASAAGIMHDVPRVPLQFRTIATLGKTLVARIPRDAQYMLKQGEIVVVYSDAFDDLFKRRPTAFADPGYPKPSKFSEKLSKFTKLGFYSAIALGMTGAFPPTPDFEEVQSENPDLGFPPNIQPKYLLDDIPENPYKIKKLHGDPFYEKNSLEELKARRAARDIIYNLEARIPIILQGMQVLDVNGEVRFEAVCDQGLEFR
ncbi:hypothetical protein KY343_00450 [Candidatus Woesearchaeota archaeon]|nr:hypothetical protein [Candidatus Woesearchaeota archaeon]